MQIPVGHMGNLSYIIYKTSENSAERDAVLIDPAWEAEKLAKLIKEKELNLRAVLLTHGHFDHSNAVPAILRAFPGISVYMRAEDADLPEENFPFISFSEGFAVPEMPQITAMLTPGHTGGSACWLLSGADAGGTDSLFTGDTLFAGACGRIDFPESLPDRMHGTLRRLAQMKGNPAIFPGHSYNRADSTLADEIRTNPYMKAAMELDKNGFLEIMMY